VSRARARRWWQTIRPRRRALRADVLAGLPGALTTVPSGMACALLAGVNPVQGVYANLAGPVGDLATGTAMMMVTTTAATALAAQSALQDVPPADRAGAISLLALLAGLVMVGAGLARVGRYARFVSYSVMSGFLAGVAVNIVASQLPTLVGAGADGSVPLARALDVAVHPSRFEGASVVVGLAAAALVAALRRTRLVALGAMAAVVLPSLAVGLGGVAGVATVDDVGHVGSGVPLPAVPHLGLLTPDLVASAFAVALIGLLQGVGVSEAVPKDRRGRRDTDRDFVGQGVGNLASAVFRGTPVGASVSQSALMLAVGSRSRWAAVATAGWLAVGLLVLSGPLGSVAMPTLAAVLTVAAALSIRPDEVRTIWRTGRISQVAMATTFLATLLLGIPEAVGIGVALSLLLQLNREAMDLTVVRLTPGRDADAAGGDVSDDGTDEERADDGWIESPAPDRLPSHEVVVLDVYGSLLYAGARTLQARLPQVGGARSPVVVLRLRGRAWLGATALAVLADYADELGDAGGRLYLTGLRRPVVDQMRRSGELDLDGPEVAAYEATPRVGASTTAAYEDAESWLVHRHPDASSPDDGGEGPGAQ
jgi:sulfate permease, SulP family